MTEFLALLVGAASGWGAYHHFVCWRHREQVNQALAVAEEAQRLAEQWRDEAKGAGR